MDCPLYTSIDNSDLDSVVDEIKVIFPNCGYHNTKKSSGIS